MSQKSMIAVLKQDQLFRCVNCSLDYPPVMGPGPSGYALITDAARHDTYTLAQITRAHCRL